MGKKQKTNGGDAVIYARYSSHNQRDVSIEQQVEACRKHAAELGLTVTATYEDRAISGKTDKRPSFQRMMRDAEQHKFAYVLAWKSNRIGRNMMQALVNESRLVDCGVKVFYAEEDFDDNAAGRFALRSMMNVNQFYIENMAEDVKRGLYDNAKKGLVNGSLPLGYKRGADGKPEIDEPKAAIVREIYTRVAAGELFASIADDLNARGIKTARGREWNKVLYDERDVRDYTPEQLQQKMSYIEQNVFLFNTTIRENITLGEHFTDEQMEKALRDSALAGDLANMPKGLDTPVGEEGNALSGGQKQRVAIARALIHNRSILLVDEGTSALDQKNADIVEKSLLSNPDLTLILISHHLSDERKAQFDHVYELTPASSIV